LKKMLIVIDMQNDFVTGVLGTKEAKSIVPYVCQKVQEYKNRKDIVIFTKDTHDDNFVNTQEGKGLPIHCKIGTYGHDLIKELDTFECIISNKCSFTSVDFAREIMEIVKKENIVEIELCGLCTDICVIFNALVIKAALPELSIKVDALACAGVTPEKHKHALSVLESCQVFVQNA